MVWNDPRLTTIVQVFKCKKEYTVAVVLCDVSCIACSLLIFLWV